MRFSYTIHPKKRGNWRPMIECSFSFPANELEHRPRFPDVFLMGRNPDIPERDVVTLIDNYPLRGFDQPIVIPIRVPYSKGTKGEPWILFGNAENGDRAAYRSCGCGFSGCRHGTTIQIINSGYHAGDVNRAFSFYGPWKPGSNPDYREIVPVLFEIRDWLLMIAREGLDSGSSEMISGDMTSSGETWIGTGLDPNASINGKGNDDSRCIELD